MCTKDELHILAVQSMQSGRRESLEGLTDDAFCRILPSTKVTFLANKYKFVFVLDFSPSAIAVVSTLKCSFCLYVFTLELTINKFDPIVKVQLY